MKDEKLIDMLKKYHDGDEEAKVYIMAYRFGDIFAEFGATMEEALKALEISMETVKEIIEAGGK